MEIPEPIAIVTRGLSSNNCHNEMIVLYLMQNTLAKLEFLSNSFVSLSIRISKAGFFFNIQVSEIKTEIVLIIWEWIDLAI